MKPTMTVHTQAPVMAPYTGSKLLANDLDSSLANLVGSESLFLAALLVCLCGFLYLLGHKSLTFKLHLCYSTEQRVSSHMVLYAGPSLVGRKVVTIIGAHGYRGLQRFQTAYHSSSLSFAHVVQPCQFKHSSDFKSFKCKKMRKNSIQYSIHTTCMSQFAVGRNDGAVDKRNSLYYS